MTLNILLTSLGDRYPRLMCAACIALWALAGL